MPAAITIHGQDDLIAAPATAPGRGAIAIIRIDGPGVAELTRALFKPAGRTHPADAPRTAVFGRWIDPADRGVILDEGLAIVFRAPHSFTGNDLAEFHIHGGTAVQAAMLDALRRLGARSAEPGEFTRRAFLNGRMDLTEAEAVADLIAAQTGDQARLAQRQLAGGLSRGIEEVRAPLIRLAAEIEARIDFPEDDLDFADHARLAGLFDRIAEGIGGLLATRGRGRLMREGASAVLVGPPNTGKSSLLNALARADRAIVTPCAGTTRDTVECVINLRGVPLTLIDTAGLRDSEEPVERIGIERSLRAASEADLVIEVRDASGAIPDLTPGQLPGRAPGLVVYNKIDLAGDGPSGASGAQDDQGRRWVAVSATTGEGIEELEAALGGLLGAGPVDGGHEIAVGTRHAELLERAQAALAEARAGWNESRGGELVMIDLRECLGALDQIIGAAPHEAVLDEVFARFCLGK